VTWIDAALVLTVAALVGLAAERRLMGLLVGLGGLLALRPLLVLGALNPWLAVVAALLVGLALALLGRHVLQLARVPGTFARVAGGAGGLLLGVALTLALVTSLPVQRNPVEPALIYYPPRDLPPVVQQAVAGSAAVAVGRDVLLHPLLMAQGAVPEGRAALYGALHRWVVVGEPWQIPGS
jgi:hypothetical protein